MRNLTALLALLAFMPTANADSEVTNSGEYRVRYIGVSNVGGADGPSAQDMEHDFRWNVNFKANDKFSANLTLMHDTTWGEDLNEAQDQKRTSTNGTTQANSLRVVEAYGSWMASDELSFRFGRGAFEMADGRVVATEYNTVPNSFEGVLGTYDAEVARISFFGIKGFSLNNMGADTGTTADDAPADSDQEINFFGFSYDAKGLPDMFKTAHFHFLKIAGQEVPGVESHDDMRYGIVLGGDTAGVDYRLTYEMQGGSRGLATAVDQNGTMMDLEVGYSMPDMMNMRFFALYHADSGDDQTDAASNDRYDGFYYDKWQNGGFMRAFDWGNLTYMHAGFSMDAADELTAGLSYYQFSMTEAKGAITSGAFGNLAANAGNTDTALATEIDVWATKKYGENFSITGAYSMLTPDSDALETVSQLFVEANMTF